MALHVEMALRFFYTDHNHGDYYFVHILPPTRLPTIINPKDNQGISQISAKHYEQIYNYVLAINAL